MSKNNGSMVNPNTFSVKTVACWYKIKLSFGYTGTETKIETRIKCYVCIPRHFIVGESDDFHKIIKKKYLIIEATKRVTARHQTVRAPAPFVC